MTDLSVEVSKKCYINEPAHFLVSMLIKNNTVNLSVTSNIFIFV